MSDRQRITLDRFARLEETAARIERKLDQALGLIDNRQAQNQAHTATIRRNQSDASGDTCPNCRDRHWIVPEIEDDHTGGGVVAIPCPDCTPTTTPRPLPARKDTT